MKIISIIEKKKRIHKGFNTIRRKKQRCRKDVVVYEEKGTGSQSWQAWRLRNYTENEGQAAAGEYLTAVNSPSPTPGYPKKDLSRHAGCIYIYQ